MPELYSDHFLATTVSYARSATTVGLSDQVSSDLDEQFRKAFGVEADKLAALEPAFNKLQVQRRLPEKEVSAHEHPTNLQKYLSIQKQNRPVGTYLLPKSAHDAMRIH